MSSKEESAVSEAVGQNPALDHYDRRALEDLECGDGLSISELHLQYKKSGVLDKEKIKDRIKRLRLLEVVENNGGTWYVNVGDGE